MPPLPIPRPIHLLRWFAVLSAIVIALGAAVLGWVMSSFLTEQMFRREATLSSEFVHNVLESDGSISYLKNPKNEALIERFRNTTAHLNNMREVMRTNVYGTDRSVLWSSDASLIGQRFTDNHELDEAMQGELVVEAGRISEDVRFKREHEGLSKAAVFFVETYIPVREAPDQPVIGVVELYKAPLALTEAIHQGQWRVATAAGAGALVLYASLFWLVRRADRTMRRQQQLLRESETLAIIGEMASSVAHNIRNPLASIRSSAELNLDSSDPHAAEGFQDVLRDVDRISSRITELLHMSQQGPTESLHINLAALVEDCVKEQLDAFHRQQQSLKFTSASPPARVQADPHLIRQVLHSVLANASEAMPAGGTCVVSVRESSASWVIEIQDEGPGMGADTITQVFRPFFTTKPKGLGLGLPLARRIIERMQGNLTLRSQTGEGTTVTIELPRVA
jgi:two-component system, NtrC family, sensor histidine kinase HydH